jgi:hypothetical protein
MPPDMIITPSQSALPVDPITTNHMAVFEESTSQPGQSSASVGVTAHDGQENNVINNDGTPTLPESVNESQDMDTKLVKSKNIDEMAKSTISIAWKYYDKRYHRGKKPFTAKKWLLPWKMCRSWTVTSTMTMKIAL